MGEGLRPSAGLRTGSRQGWRCCLIVRKGARAYFSAESRKALSSVEEALSGVPLRQVARRVKLFVQGLCGSEVSIIAAPDGYRGGSDRARRWSARMERPSPCRRCCGIIRRRKKMSGCISSWPPMRPDISSSAPIGFGSSSWLIWFGPSAVVTIDPCLRRSRRSATVPSVSASTSREGSLGGPRGCARRVLCFSRNIRASR